MMTNLAMIVQLFCSLAIATYFVSQYRAQRATKINVHRGGEREMEKLRRQRSRVLSQPLSEKTRPQRLDEIVGQADGIRALTAALCGPNPQHVIIYGPPGVGKTCAARLVLEEAKASQDTPFRQDARFVEIDATCVRFDERAIADPLIGSVHDPIYQGAGAMGAAGVPQPKPGAVTKANGGVLFLDEIGELHPIQMNKLLKVLEDRKVFLESAYYSPDDPNIPAHIHDIFKNGLPADFRLVGATTCRPEDLPAAIRSRCLEIYFRALRPEELASIAMRAAEVASCTLDGVSAETAASYGESGRDIVNMIQLAAGVAMQAGRDAIEVEDLEWVAETCRMRPHSEQKLLERRQVGAVNGLAVTGDGRGVIMEIEASARPVAAGMGRLRVTGIVDEEELGGKGHTVRRKSMASASVENVLTALRNVTDLDARDFDLHVNFPGGTPVDGPSAGIAMALACYSAMTERAPDCAIALTGEVSIRGQVRPVGGVRAKIEAAAQAGAKRVIIPAENWRDAFARLSIDVVPVSALEEVLDLALDTLPPRRGFSLATGKHIREEVSV